MMWIQVAWIALFGFSTALTLWNLHDALTDREVVRVVGINSFRRMLADGNVVVQLLALLMSATFLAAGIISLLFPTYRYGTLVALFLGAVGIDALSLHFRVLRHRAGRNR